MMAVLRPITRADQDHLEEFLYQAIFVPEGMPLPDRSIIHHPELWGFIEDFGADQHDLGLIAEVDGQPVGAVWTRIRDLYGYRDNTTPVLAIALLPAYRRQGIGTQLMQAMLRVLTDAGYRQTSLHVDKANYAVKLYRAMGYHVVEEDEHALTMVRTLSHS
ncbi:GNAT family N-acetyltransferase [Stomatohabitans albus]|uniref:GNAT family N-acetyltransferase n=1 Tax=Stomatohabitans albus TaxID=3110766 RepID=UPI00300CAB58